MGYCVQHSVDFMAVGILSGQKNRRSYSTDMLYVGFFARAERHIDENIGKRKMDSNDFDHYPCI